MALHLLRRRGRMRVPRGFGLWALFCVWMLVSVVALDDEVAGTQTGDVAGRFLAFAFRALLYLSATVLLLYVGNLDEEDLPTDTVVRLLAFLCGVTVLGGVLGLLLPTLSITSPVEMLLPASLRENGYVQALVHPTLAQVQDVLGTESPRPNAPFAYTNEWGANLSYLLPFFVLAAVLAVRGRRRLAGIAVLLVALVPVTYSLNRGLWIALALAVAVTLLRTSVRDSRAAVAGVLALAGLLAALVLTPLGTVVSERVDTPHSDGRRTFIAEKAIEGSLASPLIGWGGPREPLGSPQSIAVGSSAECPQCGAPAIGTHGQLWLVLFSQGIVGAALFVAFFAGQLRRSWADRSRLGQAVTVVLLLWLVELLYYNGLPVSLQIVMIAIALGWRSRAQRSEPARPEVMTS